MIRIVLAATMFAVGLTSATAQSDLLPSTKLMRDQAQALYRGLNGMVKGEVPFDAAKADELFADLISDSNKISDAFPEGSKGKTSPNTRYSASPKVWSNKAELNEYIAKLKKVLQDNRAKAKTLEGLKEAYPVVNRACNSCHDDFRVRKG
jgi:cytochrome c556